MVQNFMDDEIIQEATEAVEHGLDAGYAVGQLLNIINRQKATIESMEKQIDEKNEELDRMATALDDERLQNEALMSRILGTNDKRRQGKGMAGEDIISMMDTTDEDFGAILTCAVRYALGRRTYMVSLVTDFVERLLPEISDKALFVIKRDIETAGNYGDERIDKPCWMQLLLKIQEEQRRRTNRKDEQ